MYYTPSVLLAPIFTQVVLQPPVQVCVPTHWQAFCSHGSWNTLFPEIDALQGQRTVSVSANQGLPPKNFAGSDNTNWTSDGGFEDIQVWHVLVCPSSPPPRNWLSRHVARPRSPGRAVTLPEPLGQDLQWFSPSLVLGHCDNTTSQDMISSFARILKWYVLLLFYWKWMQLRIASQTIYTLSGCHIISWFFSGILTICRLLFLITKWIQSCTASQTWLWDIFVMCGIYVLWQLIKVS